MMLLHVETMGEVAQSFYQAYYMSTIQHVLSVVTDTSHTAGTGEQMNENSLGKLICRIEHARDDFVSHVSARREQQDHRVVV